MSFKIQIDSEAQIAGLTETQARKALAERSELLEQIFTEAGPEMDPRAVKTMEFRDGADMANWIRKVNEELTLIGKRVSEFDELARIRAANQDRARAAKAHLVDPSTFAPRSTEAPPTAKSFGSLLSESGALDAARKHAAVSVDLDLDAKSWLLQSKAVFSTTAGWPPETTRTGRVVFDEQREIELLDIIPTIATNQSAIVYMEETTFTNAAAERAEGGAYAESALALTERSVPVRSIGTSLPVTDEQLEDEEGVRDYIEQRLAFMVRQRLDGQIINGAGVAPNLTGTLNVSGINTQAKGTDSIPDAIYKAADLVRTVGRAVPSVVIMHPTNWQGVRLLKTTDGVYIWGAPTEQGPARIWGLPVVVTTAITAGTAIVGDYTRFAGLHLRRGVQIETGYVGDDFTSGRVTFRAGLRAAVVHYRPSAFTQITGL